VASHLEALLMLTIELVIEAFLGIKIAYNFPKVFKTPFNPLAFHPPESSQPTSVQPSRIRPYMYSNFSHL
jgi:hypothetical protein